MNREYLIALAIKFNGSYYAIKKAIEQNIDVDCKAIKLQDAITILDEQYPLELKELDNPPYVLFYQGDLNLLKERRIAIIGKRNCSLLAKQNTIALVKELKDDYVIVSGLAKGIDSIGHLFAKKTIAVLGNGINVSYPIENDYLYKYLQKKQLVISEYPFDCQPKKENFPFRNRIIAALAEKIIVCEADINSGSMYTVQYGKALGKKIYAIAYGYNQKNSLGTNKIINEGALSIDFSNLDEIKGH